ncbi:hypothetical protein [Cetobacterium sp.]|uniref:hypothetical protein n=1 Tax=Cetobacterium sp. TaxID=2071632 RepID=UPI003F3061FD
MKKRVGLFMGLSVLINAQDEGTATMNIKAQIIRPLKVEVTKNIDFGQVVAGTFSRVDGEFKISGEPGKKYVVYIKELGEGNGEGQIEMKNEKDPSVKFPVRAWTDLFGLNPTMNSKTGVNYHTVGVDLNIPVSQESGNYTSNLTMIVRYE